MNTVSHVELPAGYRLLDVGEIIVSGDLVRLNNNSWRPSMNVGHRVPNHGLPYARRIDPAKNEVESPKRFYGYHISLGYKRVTIFTFDPVTHARVSRHISSPFPEYSRFQKYGIIAKRLSDFGIEPPPYKKSSKEKQ